MTPKQLSIQHRKFHRYGPLFLMLAIPMAFFFVFHYVPMAGIVVAFKDLHLDLGVLQSPWNGLDNFRQIFQGAGFLRALGNTVVISTLRLTFGFVAPIALALLLNEVRIHWYKRGIQTLSYLPHFFSWVVLGGIMLMLLNENGPINSAIKETMNTRHGVPFLTDGNWFIATLIVTGIWQTAGWSAVIYLAALAGVSPTQYEAAAVDGASRWQQVVHVTLPALVPTIVTMFILSLGSILNAGFDQIYNMYSPMVYDKADIIDTYVLRLLQTLDFGPATAAGLFKSVVSMGLVLLVNLAARRISDGEQGLW